ERAWLRETGADLVERNSKRAWGKLGEHTLEGNAHRLSLRRELGHRDRWRFEPTLLHRLDHARGQRRGRLRRLALCSIRLLDEPARGRLRRGGHRRRRRAPPPFPR